MNTVNELSELAMGFLSLTTVICDICKKLQKQNHDINSQTPCSYRKRQYLQDIKIFQTAFPLISFSLYLPTLFEKITDRIFINIPLFLSRRLDFYSQEDKYLS